MAFGVIVAFCARAEKTYVIDSQQMHVQRSSFDNNKRKNISTQKQAE